MNGLHNGESRHWPFLTRALDDPSNLIRQEVDGLIDAKAVRMLRATYRSGMGAFQVDSSGAPSGTVGTAFDLAIRFLISRQPNVADALAGAANLGQQAFAVIAELAYELGGRAIRHVDQVPAGDPTVSPLEVEARDSEALIRACWPLALAAEIYRAGIHPASPLVHYLGTVSTPTVEGLLELADRATVHEISALLSLANRLFLPVLASEPAPWFVGPTFTASQWMKADADLIAGHMLVEIKTNLGSKKATTRVPDLSMDTLRQIVGYVLHDVDDTYGLTAVSIYEARYGTLTTWPLDTFFEQIAGRPIDMKTTRASHRQILAGA